MRGEGAGAGAETHSIGTHLPDEGIRRLYFVCGPEPMLVAAEEALGEIGVPLEDIRSERFEHV